MRQIFRLSNVVKRQTTSSQRCLATSGYKLSKSRELIVEKLTGDDEGIYIWGLNRPKSKNALGKNIFKEILAAFEEIRVSRVTSTG